MSEILAVFKAPGTGYPFQNCPCVNCTTGYAAGNTAGCTSGQSFMNSWGAFWSVFCDFRMNMAWRFVDSSSLWKKHVNY